MHCGRLQSSVSHDPLSRNVIGLHKCTLHSKQPCMCLWLQGILQESLEGSQRLCQEPPQDSNSGRGCGYGHGGQGVCLQGAPPHPEELALHQAARLGHLAVCQPSDPPEAYICLVSQFLVADCKLATMAFHSGSAVFPNISHSVSLIVCDIASGAFALRL